MSPCFGVRDGPHESKKIRVQRPQAQNRMAARPSWDLHPEGVLPIAGDFSHALHALAGERHPNPDRRQTPSQASENSAPSLTVRSQGAAR